MMSSRQAPTSASIRRHVVAGVIVVGLVVGGVGGWAGTTEVAGAVVAPGRLVVDSNVKKVQHPTGGIVAELRVRDGDRVKAGELLVRLDETQARATVAMMVKDLDELVARAARLEAEREGLDEVAFPNDLLAHVDDPDVARAVAGERRLFELRRTARAGQKAQLKERIGQLKEEIDGLTGQAAAKLKEIELITQELVGVRDLWQKKLIPLTRLTSLEREAARLAGERSQLVGAAAAAKGKITETELQIIQVDQNLRTEVGKDLAEVRPKISELLERKIAAEDQLKRVEIRSPQDGRVHQLEIHTIGGVVGPGEPMMLIVPDADSLIVEARIAPQEIDQLHYRQPAVLRFTAFNQRTTPEVNGEVSLIAADLSQDQRTGASYYAVRITPHAGDIARLGDHKLVAGMPVEAFIQTEERSVISYLVKPLRDQMARAFREK
jgi:HlyD family secretion protein